MIRRALIAAAALLPAVMPAWADPQGEIVIDRDDIEVSRDTVVKPGRYRVEDKNGDGVIHVADDAITLTLDGVTLDGAPEGATPDGFEGVGVSVTGRRQVTVRGGAVRGFRVGVRGRDSPGLHVLGVDVSGPRAMRLKSTPEREDESDWLWPHENDEGQWEKNYGAGVSLSNCPRAVVRGCRARRGQNGLLLTRCDAPRVEDCDFSFLSGWGIAMYRSSHGSVTGNRCDFCVRGYSHGVYARGQDSAGILVFEQCSDNRFLENSATHSGDGFFLYAGNETLKRTGQGGCNGNAVAGNDFSCAVANGIEATFSEGNRFSDNRLDECDHGVWAGYSRRTVVERNAIERCANGISIEHGNHNLIESNRIVSCGVGIHLWWDDDKDLLASPFGKKQDTSSGETGVSTNWILSCGTGIRLEADRDSGFIGNRVEGAKTALDVAGDLHHGPGFSQNVLLGDVAVRCAAKEAIRLLGNHGGTWRVEGPQRVIHEDDLARPPQLADPAAKGWSVPPVPAGERRGRQRIVVGEWGPLDPSLPALVRAGKSAAGAATFQVVGDGVPFRVTSLTEGFAAEPESGKAPAVLRVVRRGAAAGAPSLASFALKARVGDRDLEAGGTLVTATWKVKWFAWTKDPREDAEAWKGLVAGKPLAEAEMPSLEGNWGGGSPHEGVPADRFGTVAETTWRLPAGRYRLDTVSDDGIRVWVDGKSVIDDWTWHPPKAVSAEVNLAEGEHRVRVEHFEIDGSATVRFTIEPVLEKR